MGRAIVREPSVFLMDEPLSNLDAKLRVQMRADIAALQSRLGVTTVYVTHDQSEAMTLGHRVAVLERRAAAAVRRAAGALRAAGEHVRRRLHRLAGDEPLPRAARRRTARSRSAASPCQLPPALRATARGEVVVGLRPESLELAADGHRRRGSRWSRRSAPTRTSSAPPSSTASTTKLVARVEARQAPERGRAGRAAAARRTRRTSSTRSAATGSAERPAAYSFVVVALAELRARALGEVGRADDLIRRARTRLLSRLRRELTLEQGCAVCIPFSDPK